MSVHRTLFAELLGKYVTEGKVDDAGGKRDEKNRIRVTSLDYDRSFNGS
jgi:hypothetical protein